MFDNFKAVGALTALLRDKEKIKQAGERVKETLEVSRVVGEAGGGAVRVTMSGRMEVVAVELDPSMAKGLCAGEEAREMGQRLIADATNMAVAKAQALMHEVVTKEARDLGLPDMPGLGNLLGAS